ncbi:ABC transporter permease [Luedemannella helvata]|uniref:ABC transporter permease n=1 Tax=Luedemannella helvata TaxID=349315 RepID=A0ABP4W7S7_9ACTN
MNRALQVVRIQTFTAQNGLTWPWVILATAFVINVALFSVIGDDIPGGPKTGALASIYLTAAAVGAVLVHQHLPFMLGFGVTRRTFFTATTVLTAAWSLGSGVVLYLLALIERATDGWGIRMSFFDLPFLARDNPPLQIIEYAVTLLALVFCGFTLGAIILRFGATGFWIFTVAAIVALGAAAILITWQRWWGALIGFFADQPTAVLLTVWPVAIAAVAAAGSWLIIRRVTP